MTLEEYKNEYLYICDVLDFFPFSLSYLRKYELSEALEKTWVRKDKNFFTKEDLKYIAKTTKICLFEKRFWKY